MGWRLHVLALGTGMAVVAGCKGGPPNPYPEDVVRNFVTACRTNAPERTCECAIDKIQRRFTLDEFRAFEERMAQGEAPKELVDSVADCRGR
jgi:hypothetical protein